MQLERETIWELFLFIIAPLKPPLDNDSYKLFFKNERMNPR